MLVEENKTNSHTNSQPCYLTVNLRLNVNKGKGAHLKHHTRLLQQVLGDGCSHHDATEQETTDPVRSWGQVFCRLLQIRMILRT